VKKKMKKKEKEKKVRKKELVAFSNEMKHLPTYVNIQRMS